MDPAFWRERWHEGRIAFHEGRPNSFLGRYHERVLAGLGSVLVPLCGKTEDLAYLAGRGHTVFGIELVEDAVRAFFAEHGTEAEVTRDGDLAIYRAGAITLIAGNIFAVTPAQVGDIDAIYDRAALVALPTDLRDRYVAHLRTVLAPTARRELLVALEHDTGKGPPFSVPEAEVRARFADATIETLDSGPDPEGRGMTERCYSITFAARSR
jgi:thiopurine S-methyltransferase